MSQSGMLELAHKKLYWPKPDQIWEPSGSGPKVYAQMAKEKIGEKIKREFPKDAKGVKVSVLAANPDGDETEAPIAIVCQFNKSIPSAVIKEVHRLAWSFSRARSLITIEPHLLRVWSCCEPPTEKDELNEVISLTRADISEQVANALQWVELVSGQFFQAPEHESRFKRSGAADQMLLDNLKEVREQLQKDGLDVETIHDLLARIIFIQFLFQKQDSQGRHALNEHILQDLHTQSILSKSYRELPEILDNFDDTYNLFRWLNDKFNGDLFPGKGETEEEREAEWQAEIQKVRANGNKYLKKLAEFARGDLQMKDKQLCLWKFYSFDVIPLDFISSIYEEFVKKKPVKKKESNQEPKIKKIKGKDTVHYTPEYIVDFILDGVLPWDDEEWNLKILDPACGSGIFLVKAFQRLIYRWELSNKAPISANILRSLLENNIFGVDIDKEAVRVASFSLYMTMIDSIDPLKYWDTEVCFPRLRNRQLFNADFFEENKEGFRTNEDAATYDLVLGNAPWGKNSITKFAKSWEEREENKGKWETSYGNIGLLFLPKAAALTKYGGTVTMMQPAMPILFNQSGSAKKFRNQLFSKFKIQEIVNLSALRFGLFKDAISPTCIVTFLNLQPDLDALTYICPKPSLTDQDNYHIIIEPQDINLIYPDEAISFPSVWATLMWGGRRDLAFISSLSRYPTISSLSKKGVCVYSQGIKKGAKTARKVRFEPLRDRRFLQADNFPEGTGFYLRADKLPINKDIDVEGPRIENHDAFNLPQLIIKQSWVTKLRRFTASLVTENPPTQKGILCKESFVSVHTDIENIKWLESACLIYNSKLAVYYLFLTSGRFASFIHEIKPTELVNVPLPKLSSNLLQSINYLDDIDAYICQLFSFKNSEWSLVEDLTKYTLLDFKGDKLSYGRQKTRRALTNLLENDEERELKEYCDCFLRVIKAGFGEDKEVCATIFQENSSDYLPVRLVAIYLNKSIHNGIKVETINSQDLLKLLNQLNNLFIDQSNSHTGGGIFYQRVVRLYASTEWQGEQIPTVYLIKPDKIRYWTRSMALRDADEVSADIMSGYTHITKKSEALPTTQYD